MVLCFGFWMEVMLVTHRYFSYCWAVLSYIPPASKGAGSAQVGKGEHQDSWPGLATGLFRATWHRAEQWNWGDLAKGLTLFRDWLGIGQLGGKQLCCASLFFF